jgi:DNA-binding NarL/FixJ family response regulator
MLQSIERLSPREREVLALLTAGHTNQQVALALHLREATVKGYVHSAYVKLGVQNRAQAAAWWVQHGGGQP